MQTDSVIIGYALDIIKEAKNKLESWAEYADKQAREAIPGTETKYINTRDNYRTLVKGLELATSMIEDENYYCRDRAKALFGE